MVGHNTLYNMSKSEATTAASDRHREPISTKLNDIPNPNKLFQTKNRIMQDTTDLETAQLEKMMNHYSALHQLDS